jgi:ribosomal protein S18 acetylase RimI-like enzyme
MPPVRVALIHRCQQNARMPLLIRPAEQRDHAPLEKLVIDSFEPITWQKPLDETFGPLNGRDWRQRWQSRLQNIFRSQLVLVGESEDGRLAALATATIDREAALAYVDVLAVGRDFQGRGYGRLMLRAAIEHYRTLGCKYVHLDCLTNNEAGNALYEKEGFREVARHIRWFREI